MEPKNALLAIFDIACRATLVSKENGRESGLTAGDHADLKRAAEIIAKALDEGMAATARATELEAETKTKGDQIAKLQTELDQVKAELAAKTQDRVNAELQTEDAQTNE